MRKLFHFLTWASIAKVVAGIADKVNQHPQIAKVAFIAFLNLTVFCCFWIVFYGLGLLLVPPPGHEDYKLMRTGMRIVSFVISFFLTFGVYHFVRAMVNLCRVANQKVVEAKKGFKEGGTIAVEIPRKAVDATIGAVDASKKFVVKVGTKVKEAAQTGLDRGVKIAQEKGPALKGAAASALSKTAELSKQSIQKTAGWSRQSFSQGARIVRHAFARTSSKIRSLFSKPTEVDSKTNESQDK